MVRASTIEKYGKINKALENDETWAKICTDLKCSKETIKKAIEYKSQSVPISTKSVPKSTKRVPKSTKKKVDFDLDMAVILKSLIKKVSKQYWNKSKEDIADIQKFEDYMSKRTGLEFNFVLKRRLEEEIKKFDDEIRELNGDN